MKFQIGDKVIVQHSHEEGEVVEIIDKEMVMIEVRGVRFPAYIDQLDFPYFQRFTAKSKPAEKPAKKYVDQVPAERNPAKKAVEDGVWLNFIPVLEEDEFGDEVVQSLKVHLVSHLADDLRFRFRLTYLGKTEFELQNQVSGFRDFYLHDLPFENLNDNPAFEFEFSLLKPDKAKADYFESFLKLKARQVFARIDEIRKNQQASFSYRLFERYPDRQPEPEVFDGPKEVFGNKIYEASRMRQFLEPARHEIDLHIEKLTPDWQKLNNFEKLTLQLQTLEKYLDLAIAHHQPSMIAIHGVGTGKLRDEIHEILRLRREVKFFVNRYQEKYGYGATEIYFQYGDQR